MSNTLYVTVLEKIGIVNGTFDVIVSKLDDIKKEILTSLRLDREADIHGKHMVGKNPSKDPKDIEFHYNPTYYRQHLAASIPFKVEPTIELIDAFACIGSRFGLQPLNVFVEVYQSTCGYNPIWAKIFYVADSEIAICTIIANTYRRTMP